MRIDYCLSTTTGGALCAVVGVAAGEGVLVALSVMTIATTWLLYAMHRWLP